MLERWMGFCEADKHVICAAVAFSLLVLENFNAVVCMLAGIMLKISLL